MHALGSRSDDSSDWAAAMQVWAIWTFHSWHSYQLLLGPGPAITGRWGREGGEQGMRVLPFCLPVSAFPINKVTSYKYLPPNLNVSTMLPRGLYHMGTRTSSASATLWISYFYYRKAILMVNLLNILSSMAWENSQRQSSRQELKTCRHKLNHCYIILHVPYSSMFHMD